jgi:hypothetical protein
MLDGGKTALKVVQTKPAVRLYWRPKWPPYNYCFARRKNEFPQLVTLFGRAILSEHFSCFGNYIY